MSKYCEHGPCKKESLHWNKYLMLRFSAYSLVGFSQGLSDMIRCFSLTINQHRSDLPAQKPTSEHVVCVKLLLFGLTLLVGVVWTLSICSGKKTQQSQSACSSELIRSKHRKNQLIFLRRKVNRIRIWLKLGIHDLPHLLLPA